MSLPHRKFNFKLIALTHYYKKNFWFNCLTVYYLTMPGSQQLSKKLKSTPKIALRSRVAIENTPTTSTEPAESNEDLVKTIRAIIKEELEEHEKNINNILKSSLETTNKRLEDISKEVRDITESLEFTQSKLDDEIALVKKRHFKDQI